LFIRAGRSNYIEDRDTPLIRQIFPRAEILSLLAAGHWVHIDQPDEFFHAVVSFLSLTA
jgi:pimeloyl-ACP methyl ester carboxylesterase